MTRTGSPLTNAAKGLRASGSTGAGSLSQNRCASVRSSLLTVLAFSWLSRASRSCSAAVTLSVVSTVADGSAWQVQIKLLPRGQRHDEQWWEGYAAVEVQNRRPAGSVQNRLGIMHMLHVRIAICMIAHLDRLPLAVPPAAPARPAAAALPPPALRRGGGRSGGNADGLLVVRPLGERRTGGSDLQHGRRGVRRSISAPQYGSKC